MKMNSKFMQEKYGLEETARLAFSDKTGRSKHLNWWVNREAEIEQWERIIEQSTSLGKNGMVFIIGSYGRGKTLSLLKVIDKAEKYKEIYPIYLTFKGEEKSKPGLDFIFRVFKTIDFDRLTKEKSNEEIKNAIENIPKNFEEARNVLSKIYFNEDGGYSTDLFASKLQDNRKSEISKLALFFLRGEIKPTALQLKQLRVIRKIDNIDIAKEYLAANLSFLKNLGYKVLLLAIDEFEYLFSLIPKSQHSTYVALLRGLYDFPSGILADAAGIANMVFFIAISESGWNSLKEMEKREVSTGGPTVPLLERIDRSTTLGVFDKNQTRQLIEKRLKYNRIKGKFEDKPLIPFTEDFVDFIYDKTGGEPRAIVVRCGIVLDAGLAERVPLINKKFAEQCLEERGF